MTIISQIERNPALSGLLNTKPDRENKEKIQSLDVVRKYQPMFFSFTTLESSKNMLSLVVGLEGKSFGTLACFIFLSMG